MDLEKHSIGFIPETERYGHPRRLFTVWFGTNLSIVCMTVGMLGVFAGLSFGWALLALVIGNAIGTVFMAAHSAQGPHLGVPQMIQSRAQFGVLGAALPLLAVVVTYTLYNAANGAVVGPALAATFGLGSVAAPVIFGIATVLVAFVGYELIHRIGAAMSVLSGLALAATALILWTGTGGAPAPVAVQSGFAPAIFLATITQATAWGLTYGPYVADYSRYLPSNVSTARTFWATALGCFLGSTLTMVLGAWLASFFAAIAGDPGVGIPALFGPLALPVRLLLILGLLLGNVMTLYSAYMASAGVLSGFHRRETIGLGTKLALMAALIAVATVIAIATAGNFEHVFGDMLSLMVYLLVPWSAINLADYYWVRRGRYEVPALFDLDGQYGRFNAATLAIYAATILIELPFLQVAAWTGPMARWIGADIGWLPGLVVPGLLYTLIERRRLARQ
ncbi:cytosine permease [Sphingomonas sp. CGMCC 1.13654]|uniref:Cytosine permease n=1 Tax=Sphingomonas chungangi TaxID=2683589 RepID=A0A838L554_9SPHN|nr:cytosine permease [Sphingomonas chungangi]MBA2934157.1 cytosine permease [Sphingomonas chungangi]MVW57198.1 cytosine permease [Sphingomonas chungangi]